jgi:hypothetical protein
MRWSIDQCRSQAAGISRLQAEIDKPGATSAMKKALKIAKALFSEYHCKGTLSRASTAELTLSPVSSSSSSGSGRTELTNSNRTENMGLLDTLSSVVTAVTGSGRASTSGPSTDESPSLLDVGIRAVGTVLSAVVPGAAAIGTGLGTLAESPPNSTVGRALNTDLPLEYSSSNPPLSAYPMYARTRKPSTAKVRRLVHCVGVESAASMLGLSITDTAMIATRPYRRRGISAASLRITRRTIRAVNSITHSLSKIKRHR